MGAFRPISTIIAARVVETRSGQGRRPREVCLVLEVGAPPLCRASGWRLALALTRAREPLLYPCVPPGAPHHDGGGPPKGGLPWAAHVCPAAARTRSYVVAAALACVGWREGGHGPVELKELVKHGHEGVEVRRDRREH